MNELADARVPKVPRGYRLQTSVAAFCILFIAILWLTLWFQMSNERRRMIGAALHETDNIARLFEEHVRRTLAAASITLRQIETEYKRNGKSLDLAKYLRERQQELEPYTILSVVDEQGNLILNNVPFSRPQNVLHLENTQFHMNNPTQEIFISKPLPGIVTDRQTIYLTRRMNKADGSFGGNTGLGINPQDLSRLYEQIRLGPNSVMVLAGRDGIVRARGASKSGDVGQDISRGPLFTRYLPVSEQGQFRAISPLDGVARLHSYRAVKDYPLVVLVGTSEASVLAPFEQTKRVYLWWASGVSLAIFAFGAMLLFQIAHRERANERLRASEERLQAILDNTTSLVYLKDRDGRFLLVNRTFAKLFGAPPEALVGKTSHDIVDREQAPLHRANDVQVLTTGMPLTTEELNKEADGQHTYLTVKFPLRDTDGNISAVCGISTDITERKRAEEQIKISLQEKETLLKEIHHRVKNNLQIISSLLYLQSGTLRDPAARQALKESQDRVHSIGLVHEQLFRSSDFNAIDFGEHLKRLIANVIGSYGAMNPRVRVETEVESTVLDLDLAIPASLIFNEILTNAFKHAFPGQRAGTIRVVFRRDGSDKLMLRVSDDGVGLPEELNWENGPTIGLKIVRNLTSQIHGELNVQSTGGVTMFQLSFPRARAIAQAR